ncbi:NAD-P-binding protein [Russula earlei]|uniref:NAD-P-binding protein n=1 Tax=Russula earlei TaxID=71964 RepID=A0ACC0U402_9AGAM|nr:NAD-P-binding protein [Russula earlei]
MALLVLSATHLAILSASFSPQLLRSIIAHAFFALSHPHSDDTRPSVEAPHRTALDLACHRALFMPARIANIGTAIKVVSVPSVAGDTRGLPATTLVLDENTGAAKAVINARSLTALRTAAGSLLATVLLHPPATARFTSLVAFGAGSQIRSHVTQLLATYPSITRITVVNRSINDRVTALLGCLRADHPTTQFTAISSVDSLGQVESAVRQADCVCCATSSTAPLFRSEWVRPRTHIILVGSYKPEMAEVDSALIRRARVLVDSRSACALEAGELICAGIAPEDMVEVGELLLRAPVHDEKCDVEIDAARIASVLDGGDVTIFKSVGVGAQDVAISVAVVTRAMEMGIGTRIPDFDASVDLRSDG